MSWDKKSISLSGLTDVDTKTIAPLDGNVLTFSSGVWQPKAPSSGVNLGSYTLELSRWGVSDTVTNYSDSLFAYNNVTGINNAIVWASQQGYNEFVLPKGIYLISETQGIELQSFMTLNLGGSTLRVRNNGAIGYSIVQITQGQKFCRITNGIIEGDRDYHDYTTISSTHEFGAGIMLSYGGSYISVDNLEIRKCTGDGVQLISAFNMQPGFWSGYDLNTKQVFEVGGISTVTGTLDNSIDSQSKYIRTSVSFQTTSTYVQKYGVFGLYGDSYGGVGTGITTDVYDCIFYKSDGTFHSSVTKLHLFDDILIPTGAASAKFVLHQPTIPAVGTCSLQVSIRTYPKYIYIEKNNLHDNRRCAVGLTGCKYVFIRDNDMSFQKGTTPQSASDIEDGYDLNQYIYFERNRMYLNQQYTVTALAGRQLYFRGNLIGEGIFDIASRADRTIVEGNWFINSSCRLIGDTIFTNNMIYDSEVSVMDTNADIVIGDCIFHNTQFSINRTKSFCTLINNCKFTFDADFRNQSGTRSPVILAGQPQMFINCSFEGYGTSRFMSLNNVQVGWKFNNIIFIDTKMDNGTGIGLPPGSYNRCTFNNTGRIGLGITDVSQVQRYHFDNCTFQWSGFQLFYVGANPKVDTVSFNYCHFFGSSDQAFYFVPNGQWGRIEIINSSFEYNDASLPNSIPVIQFYNSAVSIDSLLVQNTLFSSNTSLLATDSSKLPTSTVQIFKDNTFKFMNVIFHEMAIKSNNNLNGAIDPYSNIITLPTDGYYKLGQILTNANPQPNGYIGWICTTQGYVENGIWTSSKTWVAGNRIVVTGYVYQAQNAGTSMAMMPTFPNIPTSGQLIVDSVGLTNTWSANTSYTSGAIIVPSTPNGCYYVSTTGTSGATEPTWKTTGTTIDNNIVWTAKGIITWKEIGPSAIFKQFGAIQS